jgi:hypothetical protein
MVGVHPGHNFLGSTEMNRKKFVSFSVDLDNLTHLSFRKPTRLYFTQIE